MALGPFQGTPWPCKTMRNAGSEPRHSWARQVRPRGTEDASSSQQQHPASDRGMIGRPVVARSLGGTVFVCFPMFSRVLTCHFSTFFIIFIIFIIRPWTAFKPLEIDPKACKTEFFECSFGSPRDGPEILELWRFHAYFLVRLGGLDEQIPRVLNIFRKNLIWAHNYPPKVGIGGSGY